MHLLLCYQCQCGLGRLIHPRMHLVSALDTFLALPEAAAAEEEEGPKWEVEGQPAEEGSQWEVEGQVVADVRWVVWAHAAALGGQRVVWGV